MKRWIEIPGFDGRYKINNRGIIKNSSGMLIKQQKQNSGYLIAHLYGSEGRKALTIHRIVAKLFVPNPENKPQVNHDDLDKENNYYKNLKWSTRSENMRHAFDSGRMDNAKEKARERMKIIGKKFSKVNGNRLRQMVTSKDYINWPNCVDCGRFYNPEKQHHCLT